MADKRKTEPKSKTSASPEPKTKKTKPVNYGASDVRPINPPRD